MKYRGEILTVALCVGTMWATFEATEVERPPGWRNERLVACGEYHLSLMKNHKNPSAKAARR